LTVIIWKHDKFLFNTLIKVPSSNSVDTIYVTAMYFLRIHSIPIFWIRIIFRTVTAQLNIGIVCQIVSSNSYHLYGSSSKPILQITTVNESVKININGSFAGAFKSSIYPTSYEVRILQTHATTVAIVAYIAISVYKVPVSERWKYETGLVVFVQLFSYSKRHFKWFFCHISSHYTWRGQRERVPLPSFHSIKLDTTISIRLTQ